MTDPRLQLPLMRVAPCVNGVDHKGAESPCTPRLRFVAQRRVEVELQQAVGNKASLTPAARAVVNLMSDHDVRQILRDPDDDPRIGARRAVHRLVNEHMAGAAGSADDERVDLSLRAATIAQDFNMHIADATALTIAITTDPQSRRSSLHHTLRRELQSLGPCTLERCTSSGVRALVHELNDNEVFQVMHGKELGASAVHMLAAKGEFRHRVRDGAQKGLESSHMQASQLSQVFVDSLTDEKLIELVCNGSADLMVSAHFSNKITPLLSSRPPFADAICLVFLDSASAMRLRIALGQSFVLPVPPPLRVLFSKRPCSPSATMGRISQGLVHEWYKFLGQTFGLTGNCAGEQVTQYIGDKSDEYIAWPTSSGRRPHPHGVCLRLTPKHHCPSILVHTWRSPGKSKSFELATVLTLVEKLAHQSSDVSCTIVVRQNHGSWPVLRDLPQQVTEVCAAAILLIGSPPWPVELQSSHFVAQISVPIFNLNPLWGSFMIDAVNRCEQQSTPVILSSAVHRHTHGILLMKGNYVVESVSIQDLRQIVRLSPRLEAFDRVLIKPSVLDVATVELTPCCDWEA